MPPRTGFAMFFKNPLKGGKKYKKMCHAYCEAHFKNRETSVRRRVRGELLGHGGFFQGYGTRMFFTPPLPRRARKAWSPKRPRRGGGRIPPPPIGPWMAPLGGPDSKTFARRKEAATGRPFLWFVSFGRTKEMNTKHYASMTAIIPARNIPSKVPAPPIETRGASIFSMSFK